MKKNVITALAIAALPLLAVAQEEKKEIIIEKMEQPDGKGKSDKKESQEIIIRQNGNDKDIHLKVEVNGDEVTVNGKPLSEFTDKNITINKRKMTITDGNNTMLWNFSGDGDFEKLGEAFSKNFGDQWEGGKESKGAFLGVTTEKEDEGVKIVEVVKGSAAEKTGLKIGDIITRVGDEKITSADNLADVISLKKPDEEVNITYKRAGKINTVKAILGKRKSQVKVFSFGGPGNGGGRSFNFPGPGTNMEGNFQFDGPLDEELEHLLPPRQKKIGLKIQDIEEGSGVKVITVEDSSAAAIAGIKKDDIITEINGKKINNTDDAREELVPDPEKKLYKIKLNRAGSEMNVDVKIPKKLKTANL